MTTSLCFCTRSAERLKSAYLASTGTTLSENSLRLLAGQKLHAKDYDKNTRSGKIEDPEQKGRWITLPPNSLVLIGDGCETPNKNNSENPVKRTPVQRTPQQKTDVVSRMLHQNEKIWKDRDKNETKVKNLEDKRSEEDDDLKREFMHMKNFASALNKIGEQMRERQRKQKAKLLQRKVAQVPVACERISEMPCASAQTLCEEDVKRFHSEGAICIKGVIDEDTIETMRNSVMFEKARAQNIQISSMGTFDSPYETKSGFNSLLMSLKNERFHEFATNPELEDIARRFMRSKSCSLLYDHIIIKDKKHTYHTSWHFDLNYWPLKGDDMVSMWILLDDCPCDAGLLQFVRGSHLEDHSEIPHVEHMRGKELDVMGVSNMKAGDAMLFWGKTLHGASGNLANAGSRRAISLRYLGDNVWFDSDHEDCPSDNYAYCKGVLMGALLTRKRPWIQREEFATAI